MASPTKIENGMAHPTNLKLELDTDVSDVHVSSSGNMSFEVALSEQLSPRTPGSIKSPLAKKMHSPRRELTVDYIEDKLKAAEQRRVEQEQAIKERAAAEQEKIAAANARRDELESNFKQTVEKEIENKLEANKENREKLMAARAEKAKQENEKCKNAQELRETRLAEVIKSLAEKVEEEQLHAEELRKHKYEELQERLQKEYDSVQAARQVLDRKEFDDEAKWQNKLECATKRRDMLLEAIKSRQSEHDKHVTEVQAKKKVLGERNAAGDSKHCSLQ